MKVFVIIFLEIVLTKPPEICSPEFGWNQFHTLSRECSEFPDFNLFSVRKCAGLNGTNGTTQPGTSVNAKNNVIRHQQSSSSSLAQNLSSPVPDTSKPKMLKDVLAAKLPREVGCRNENNDVIDYFVVYKPPQTYEYFVKYPGQELEKGNQLVDSDTSVFGQTTFDIYNNKEDDPINFLLWNDNINGRVPPKFAHSKGVLAFKNHAGFLMVHTVPDFLTLKDNYNFPMNGKRKGQMSWCITIRSENDQEAYLKKLCKLLKGLRSFELHVAKYYYNPLLDRRVKKYFEKLIHNKIAQISELPQMFYLDLTQQFRAYFFSKHDEPKNKDIQYDAFVELAKIYHVNLFVQSWIQIHKWSSRVINNEGEEYTVENVKIIKIQEQEEITWISNRDHSKWAVSKSHAALFPLACFSDLNRYSSTMARGGIIVCTKETSFQKMFYNFVKEYEPVIRRP